MSNSTYEIIGLATIYLAIGFFMFMFLVLVAYDWLNDKVQRIKRLFKKKKSPTRTRNRTVVRRTAKRTTARTVRRRHA